MNSALLGKMNSPVFENSIAREAFSFDQLLEIVSNENSERALESILRNPNSRTILKYIGEDSQSWQAKFQYLINLESAKRRNIIDRFGNNGEGIIQNELERREKCFESMEKGYIQNEESDIMVEYEFDQHSILDATFGISYNEAKELIKKYGTDFEKLSIQNEADKKICRKFEIIKEIINLAEHENDEKKAEYYRMYYYFHKKELLAISKDVSPFYKVDMEREFLDLYARQYDRALGIQANRIQDVTYDGKNIPVYEVSGDFMILIRGEQNVSPENKQNFWNATQIQVKGLCQCTIRQDYIRTVNYDRDDTCFTGAISCKDGELRMASTTNIKSKEANNALSNLGLESDYRKWYYIKNTRRANK